MTEVPVANVAARDPDDRGRGTLALLKLDEIAILRNDDGTGLSRLGE